MIIKNPQYAIVTNVGDTTATAADVLSPKKFHQADGQLVTGTIPTYAGATTITENGTVETAGKYLASDIIVNITAPEVPKEKDVNFYDYDGTLVASYSASDFANLSALPSNQSHTGLVADGWNWTLADAKTYVAEYRKLNIGQMYHTASGKTEYDIVVDEASGFTATLSNSAEKDWGDGTVDTNTTHTYAAAGSYTIKMGGTTLPSIQNSKKVRAIRIASGVTSIGSSAFTYCYSLQSVTIPSGVTSIGSSAFTYCYSLQSVTIPSGVTSLGNGMFATCYSLQSVTIPSGVTSFGGTMFQNCSSLQSVTIPSTTTSFENGVFQNCRSLQSVTIPSGVTSIGGTVFSGCTWLAIVTVLATTPPTLSSTNAIPSSVITIYIPNGTLAAYQAATNWSSFSSKFVELPA